MNILGIDAGDGFETAKKAYRNLAKKYHPDVGQKDPGIQKNTEEKMKSINLAFCCLAPFLKSREQAPSDGEKKKTTPEKNHQPNEPPLKKQSIFRYMQNFFHTFDHPSQGDNGPPEDNSNRQTRHTFSQKTKRKPVFSRRRGEFKTVLKEAGKRPPVSSYRKPSPSKHQDRSDSYSRYQQYKRLKNAMASSKLRKNSDLRVSKIERITPVRPVTPV